MDNDAGRLLTQIYEISSQMVESLSQIEKTLEDNEPEKIEQFLALVTDRGKCIEQLAYLSIKDYPSWSPAETKVIKQLQLWDKQLLPKAQEIYKSFSKQLLQFQQGKIIKNQYFNEFDSLNTDGAYFDKRK